MVAEHFGITIENLRKDYLEESDIANTLNCCILLGKYFKYTSTLQEETFDLYIFLIISNEKVCCENAIVQKKTNQKTLKNGIIPMNTYSMCNIK